MSLWFERLLSTMGHDLRASFERQPKETLIKFFDGDLGCFGKSDLSG